MKLKDARRIADTKFPVFQVLKKQNFTVVLKNCKTQAAKHSMEKIILSNFENLSTMLKISGTSLAASYV